MSARHSATAVLRDEHRLILRVVDAFDRMLPADAAGALPLDDVARCITFFRLFTDACHHGKEEDLLFAALEADAGEGVLGAITAMRDEHVYGRLLVKQMTRALDGAATGDDAACGTLLAAAVSYIDFIRAHIGKEDGGLFDLADDAIVGTACNTLCAAYDNVCGRRFEGHSLQDLEDLAAGITEARRVPGPGAG